MWAVDIRSFLLLDHKSLDLFKEKPKTIFANVGKLAGRRKEFDLLSIKGANSNNHDWMGSAFAKKA